ncbi:hypothetical protein AJ88_12255 [Mesorhizobium amorphae CCBAU 01583]|nr:hypothetical protein AJ88_12255 [Mesorhizobium amorphae CCBAU 01583]
MSVSRQMSPRQLCNPFGRLSVKGELANSAVDSGCSLSDTCILRRMSASLSKSRFTWMVQVRYIMSRPFEPTFGM